MKNLGLATLFAISLFLPSLPAVAAPVENMSFLELQHKMKANPMQNVIVEFYNSRNDGLECDRCQMQEAEFFAIAARHGNAIRFVRVDVNTAPYLVELGLVGIYPTHLFIRHDVPEHQEIVAKRIRGFLTAKQMESLIQELFELNKKK